MTRSRRLRVEPLEDRRMLATFTVTNLLDGPVTAAGQLPGSLRQAIFDANTLAGADEIELSAVTGTISLNSGRLLISDALTILGPGANQLTIDASGNDPTPASNNLDGSGVFYISDSNVNTYLSNTISGLTITGADKSEGAIQSFENLTLSAVTITDNNGGNTVFSLGDLVVVDSQMSGNSGGSVIAVQYFLDMNTTTISNNSASAITGDFFFAGEINITDSTISGNTSSRGGGIFISRYYDDVTATITNTIISGNTATLGSAIYSYGGDIILIDSTVSGNLGLGSAIDIKAAPAYSATGLYGGSLTLNNTDVLNNSATGVSIISAGSLTVTDSSLSGNAGTGLQFQDINDGGTGALITNSTFNNNQRGLAFLGYGSDELMSVTIQGSEISANVGGGGLYFGGNTQATITNTVISNNQNLSNGGGIEVAYGDSLEITGSTITGNTVIGTINDPYGDEDGYGKSGGGIWSNGDLTIVDSQITNNVAANSQTPYIFFVPSRGGNGGGIAALGNLTISGSTITDNHAGDGAGFHGDGGHGGGIFFSGDVMRITSSTVSGNSSGDGGGTYGGSSGHGGGIHASGTKYFDDVEILANYVGASSAFYSGGHGGGLFANGFTEIRGSTITGNRAGDGTSVGLNEDGGDGGSGGGARISGETTIIDSVVSDNRAGHGGDSIDGTGGDGGYGGGLNSFGPLTLINTVVSGNSSGEGGSTTGYGTGGRGGHGGGLFAAFAELTLISSTIVGNSTGRGMGVSYGASPGGDGGGIAAIGAVAINNSTVSSNTTGQGGNGGEADGGAGGGLWLSGYNSKQLLNSTISGNSTGRGGADGRRSYAGDGGDGGGVFVTGTGILTVTHSTITGNTTGLNGPESYGPLGYGGGALGNGGGIFASTANVILTNTIVAGNTRGSANDDDLKGAGTFVPAYSLIGVNTGATITPGTGNQIGTSGTPVDPLLGPLADNSGPTFTHALLPGSPAIDAGDPAFTVPPDYDQRGTGYDRVANGRTDMGAFETQVSVSLPGDFNGDGVVTGRDFLAWQRGESLDPYSSDDLEIWQEEYNGGELSVLSANLSSAFESDGEESAWYLVFTAPNSPPTEVGSPGGFDGNELFVESVDLAIEALSAATQYGVREFGELIVRRKANPRLGVL